jgi:hypothetical protein
MDPLVTKVVEAIASFGLAPALEKTEPDDAQVFWCVIGRVRGNRLLLAPICEPTTFDNLAHVEVKTISLPAAADPPAHEAARLFREAAHSLVLPRDARAIPFALVSGGSDATPGEKWLCGVAFPGAPLPEAILIGNRLGDPLASLQLVAMSEAGFTAVNIDAYSERFGTIATTRSWEGLTSTDVGANFLGFEFDQRVAWSLTGNIAAEVAQAKKLLERKAGRKG